MNKKQRKRRANFCLALMFGVLTMISLQYLYLHATFATIFFMNTDEYTMKKQYKFPLIDPFEEQPGCSLLIEHAMRKKSEGVIPLKDVLSRFGKYVCVNSLCKQRREPFREPRYDHVSCSLMKPRYNCAIKNPNGTVPSDVTLMLDKKTSTCDLQKFVHDAAGPAGIGYHIKKTRNEIRKSEKPSVEVLLIGNSKIRQVFEALVCGFQDQITEHIFQFKAPSFTLDHQVMEIEEFSPLVDIKHFRNGSCYNPDEDAEKKHSRWYRKDGSIIPKNHEFCNDNVASAEFIIAGRSGKSEIKTRIRFYLLVYPWTWTNFTTPFEALGIQRNREIDFLFHEGDNMYGEKADFDLFLENYINVRNKISMPHYMYEIVSLRSLGAYFGVDNPGLYEVPDTSHQCMPGPPDDKVNSILWYMLSLAKIEKRNIIYNGQIL